jgi:hypothetical protein
MMEGLRISLDMSCGTRLPVIFIWWSSFPFTLKKASMQTGRLKLRMGQIVLPMVTLTATQTVTQMAQFKTTAPKTAPETAQEKAPEKAPETALETDHKMEARMMMMWIREGGRSKILYSGRI